MLRSRALPTGDLAVMLVLPRDAAARIDELLAAARVPEIAVPAAYAGVPLADAAPRMLARLDAIPGELDAVNEELGILARDAAPELHRAARAARDTALSLSARHLCGVTPRAFAVEGWLPGDTVPTLEGMLAERFRGEVTVETVAREEWATEGAPVVLHNPRLLRPFETLVRIMPLPRYGTIDPTPFVAVFFPLFFGMMLGDVAYGVALALLGVIGVRRTRPGTTVRAVSEVALPCAAFTIIFGVLYGEALGDLGRRWLGMRPILFDREEAVVAGLAVAVGIGVVHIVLGLVLGAVGALRGHPRVAVGRGAAAVMVVLIVLALLAAFEVLPSRFFTPMAIAVLVLFPIIIAAEGLLGAIELFTTIGNILSYARIMAIGTASVMLAVVANRMVGAIGSTVVGLMFALLFHLVNFAIGLFSPTIHALRLHYVEFFGKFYSPGGQQYRPFAHWSPGASG
jgi:V/A-type H+-transporting ATPase subunit I